MEDIEKLSCKEEWASDLEHSASEEHKEMDDKSKKRKRRRREVDMIKISDDEDDSDDENPRKKVLQCLSPALNSSASQREPRTCVLKASQKRRPLSRLLEQLLRNLEKRDPHQFFAWPVNDNFAPNYSNIIKKPMDFSTIKQKIDDNEYKSLNCFIADFKLMCKNAMKYNKPGTVYHKTARRLLHAGLRQLTPQKLRPLGNILTYMYEIPIRELGFDIGKMDLHKVLKRSNPLKSGGSEAEATSDGGGDALKMKMERAREKHRKKLAKKAFPRMDSNGKTTLCLATAAAEIERHTLGAYVGRLQHGTATLTITREDPRDMVKGVKPLSYGPFSTYAPAYDSTFATLTHEESHMLYHTLPSEMGEGNEHLLRFAPNSPWSAIYDMDAMFPSRKTKEASPAKSKEDQEKDLSKVKVNIDNLRSLSELGVDVDFLNDIEDDVVASQKDYGIGPALQHTLTLLTTLEKEQIDRLNTGGSTTNTGAPSGTRPTLAERAAARSVAVALAGMSARVPPKALVPTHTIRAAMGVTLDHLDTPMSVDELSELEAAEPRDVLDPDSRPSHDK